MARASENDVVSGAVGPEAIESMGSPMTSDIINEITRAGDAHLASCPPLMSDRCLRTAFSSRIVAPARSKRDVVCCFSCSVIPSDGAGHKAEAHPEIQIRKVA